MTDRTPQQVDMTLDRVEQISAQNTVNIAELQTYISQFVRAVDQRLGSVDRQLGSVDRQLQSVDQQLQAHKESIARQDALIQLLSTYITGTPPQAD